jgi:Trypsin-like peptidase domain
MMYKIPGMICIGFAIISQALIDVGNAGLQPEQLTPPCPASDNKVDIKCVAQQAKDIDVGNAGLQPEQLTPPCPASDNKVDIKCVAQQAKDITVKISPKNLESRSSASGSLIGKKANTYYILTNAHVVKSILEVSKEKSQVIQVKTPDGKIHEAFIEEKIRFDKYDLALISFNSDRPYKVPVLGDTKQIKNNDPIFVGGFKCKIPRECREEYDFTSGRVYTDALKLDPLYKGYNLGYSNIVTNGMSGGTVLDSSGRLIGVNGRSRYFPKIFRSATKDVPDIDPLTFLDGRKVDIALEEKIKSHSWGIPLDTFLKEIEKIIDTPAGNRVINNTNIPQKIDSEIGGILQSSFVATNKPKVSFVPETSQTSKIELESESEELHKILLYSLVLLYLLPVSLGRYWFYSKNRKYLACNVVFNRGEQILYILTKKGEELEEIQYKIPLYIDNKNIKTSVVSIEFREIKNARVCQGQYWALRGVEVNKILRLRTKDFYVGFSVDRELNCKSYHSDIIYQEGEKIVLFFERVDSRNIPTDTHVSFDKTHEAENDCMLSLN